MNLGCVRAFVKDRALVVRNRPMKFLKRSATMSIFLHVSIIATIIHQVVCAFAYWFCRFDAIQANA